MPNRALGPSIEELHATVSAVAGEVPELAAVYLYGSRAAGTDAAGSDMDLALVLTAGAEPGPLFAETIASRVGERLAFTLEVDAHRVDHLPLPVLGRVVTEGVLLFERDASRRVEFETSTRRLYFDFQPFMERDIRESFGRG